MEKTSPPPKPDPADSLAPERPDDPANQFKLLGERRFAPFFWTQFLGAGNDNLFKFAVTVLVTYQLSVSWLPPELAGLVIGSVFILPFLLFSATSGQLADKYEKATLVRWLKTGEIVIMSLAALGMWFANVPILLLCIFLMGAQSTLFGPVKYAYLPQHLNERELTGGNGLVESGTFVAILLGNVAGGLLIAIDSIGPNLVALVGIALAIAGRFSARLIPESPALAPNLSINWNPLTETWRNLKLAHANLVVFRSILGISWMWAFGAVFLSQFPAFARDVIGGNEQVASLLLVIFSIGIGAGSLACEKLSRSHVEIGLVPFGAIGMSVFAADLYFATRSMAPETISGVATFLSTLGNWRVIADLTLLSFFTGLFSVPMYALIQSRSEPSHRARIIAANNIINSIFMIVSAVLAGAALGAGMTIPQVFLATAVLNAIVAAYIFLLVPEYLLRFIAWIASRLVYRFRVANDHFIPETGPAIITANHVSFVDPVLLMATSPRPITFLMDHQIFKTPGIGWVFRLAKAIPVAPQSQDAAAYDKAMESALGALRRGELVGIFPEGAITRDGELQNFRPGFLKIRAEGRQPDQESIPVIPVGLQNLWGSFFSRISGKAMSKPFRRGLGNRVGIRIGQPLTAEDLSAEQLQKIIRRLIADPV